MKLKMKTDPSYREYLLITYTVFNEHSLSDLEITTVIFNSIYFSLQ